MAGVTRVYDIKTIDSGTEWWKKVPPAEVNCFPWDSGGYRPQTRAWLGLEKGALRLRMESYETERRAEEQGFSALVYTDSCMEFFLSPDPEHTTEYLNWEFNPAGAIHLALGKDRRERLHIPVENYRDYFDLAVEAADSFWAVSYRIPLEFLKRHFPSMDIQAGCTMRGNFYKCGDKTARPHFGCWSPIELPSPEFHCPAFFGLLRWPGLLR
ncbi:hypothetical protein AGMMS50230_05870 [Spirochaetia bacterium]|nr:hypothetical protein AGMMS50230_05870 [Spirochaetia bacterium]